MANIPELGEPFNQEVLALAEQDINKGYRVVTIENFRDKESIEVKIYFPSVEVDSECAKVYSETLNSLLLSDKKIMTKDEMEELISKRNLWGKKQEDELEEIDDRINSLMREGQTMHSAKRVNKKRLEDLKTEYMILRSKRANLSMKKSSFMSNTVESMAESAALEYKLYMCCTDINGNKFWNNYDEFLKERNKVALAKLLQEAMVFWSGLPQGTLDLLPEFLTWGASSEQSQEAPSGGSDSA